jgi:hypothetical protein
MSGKADAMSMTLEDLTQSNEWLDIPTRADDMNDDIKLCGEDKGWTQCGLRGELMRQGVLLCIFKDGLEELMNTLLITVYRDV